MQPTKSERSCEECSALKQYYGQVRRQQQQRNEINNKIVNGIRSASMNQCVESERLWGEQFTLTKSKSAIRSLQFTLFTWSKLDRAHLRRLKNV